eukprot:CAMPEP_0174260700 /NCGR_PEP_ID=MMETSP0439-20130205/10309_1 /TAXON_ID=0 /ORGANISM="Stereomyxa ramosa, Strain Chinc5" /LENGTH=977 /DNA_ID=CAMNT_0015345003 /DNA_START=56 /DNA_END=2989 /DNA_ORIENTATION=+
MSKKYGVSVEALTALHQSRKVENITKDFKSLEGLCEALGTDPENGLGKADIDNKFETRRKAFGENRLPPPKETTFLELVMEGLEDKTLILLMVSAVISLVLGIMENPSSGWIEGTAILIAVALVVLVTALNDFQKEKQFRKLNARKENKQVKVIRDGQKVTVSVYDVVVGDVVIVDTGDILCADGLYLSGHNMKCDESDMTGESDAVKKNVENNPFLLSGCQVLEGIGKMLVVCVGPHSESGRALALLRKESNEATPLQAKLEVLAEQIAQLGLGAAVLILVVLLIKFFVLNYLDGIVWEWHMMSVIVNYFITSITIVVVAVPEGLPLAVTIALAYSMVKMISDNNLVRHLESCETMGGATTICSDKTGTLTTNTMTVTKIWVAGEFYDSVDKSKSLDEAVHHPLTEGLAINSTAYEGVNDQGRTVFIGNKTESALLNYSKLFGCDYSKVRKELEVTHLVPFSSKRKRMSAIVPQGDGYRLYSKGASEIILEQCTGVMNQDGSISSLDGDQKEELCNIIQKLASQGLRTIGIAYVDIDEEKDWEKEAEFLETDFVLVGIAGIKDPVRAEVPAAVKKCQEAGIIVRMVTGDNIETAKHIAEECGIYDPKTGYAIEGPDFRNMDPVERDKIVNKIQIMARSSPTDKHLLVSRLKDVYGHVVAVTGDGTNDAPALTEAHVGFAMGIAGTEVAKEASDIILMDDNFSSIVKAVMWGRNVYDSIRKFIQFQLTVNVVAVVVAFVGAVSNEHGESPLKPVQLLWVNLIMDTMAALALATEAPTEELLTRKPYGKDDPLITRTMWKKILGQAAYQLVVNFFILYYGHHLVGCEKDSVKHLTMVFNVFVLCQVFNEISCRRIYDELNIFSGVFTNAVFIGVMVFTWVVQWAIIEFGGGFASTTPLSLYEWGLCIGLGAVSIPLNFALSLVKVKEVERPAMKPVVSRSSRWAKAKAGIKAKASAKQMQKRLRLFQALHGGRRIDMA